MDVRSNEVRRRLTPPAFFVEFRRLGEIVVAKRDNRKGQAAREQDDPIGPSTALASESMMPLDFMLWIMRNPDAELADRKWAASQAAPYCHARLSTERGHDASLSHEDFLDLL